MQLNQIARVVLTTAKELFFDPYQKNKATGSFILIDPITNNTSAVGMIIDRVEDKDMHLAEDLPILNLPKLGIAPEHYEAIEKGCERAGTPGRGCTDRAQYFFISIAVSLGITGRKP